MATALAAPPVSPLTEADAPAIHIAVGAVENSIGASAGVEGSAPSLAVAEMEPAPCFTCDFEERPDGTFIWNASLVLLRYLQAPERVARLRGRRVLELGSGLGHLGHGLARLGAHVTCTERGKILPELQASLRGLDREHGPAGTNGGSLRAVELSWGEEGFEESVLAAEVDTQPFDFVISAELVFLEETHDLLLWTWQKVCRPETVIFSVFINRPFSWNFFAKLHDLDIFEVDQIEEERDFDPCGLEEIHMHKVTLKQPS
mmetsp:Transcript_122651/g.308369  ORF Transcript_122651/g.308369 Transcript_122651/m.308369 type:complete len:260 (-) Transcript_122651:111-890(-)